MTRLVKVSRNGPKPMVRSATSPFGGARADARGDAPGQELRVLGHVGHDVEKLFGAVRDDLAFGVGRHQAEAARCASRAARKAAKSASA